MNKVRAIALVAFVATLALGGAALVAQAGPDDEPLATIPGPTSAFDGNITLEPPSTAASPAIDAAAATSVALAQFPDAKVTALPAQLAAMSWDAVPVDSFDTPIGPPLYSDVLVWVIGVDGIAAMPTTGDCVNNTTNVVVCLLRKVARGIAEPSCPRLGGD